MYVSFTFIDSQIFQNIILSVSEKCMTAFIFHLVPHDTNLYMSTGLSLMVLGTTVLLYIVEYRMTQTINTETERNTTFISGIC